MEEQKNLNQDKPTDESRAFMEEQASGEVICDACAGEGVVMEVPLCDKEPWPECCGGDCGAYEVTCEQCNGCGRIEKALLE